MSWHAVVYFFPSFSNVSVEFLRTSPRDSNVLPFLPDDAVHAASPRWNPPETFDHDSRRAGSRCRQVWPWSFFPSSLSWNILLKIEPSNHTRLYNQTVTSAVNHTDKRLSVRPDDDNSGFWSLDPRYFPAGCVTVTELLWTLRFLSLCFCHVWVICSSLSDFTFHSPPISAALTCWLHSIILLFSPQQIGRHCTGVNPPNLQGGLAVWK